MDQGRVAPALHHPGPAGQTLMAWIVLKGLGATPLVSAAQVRCGWWTRAGGKNCQISNLKRDGDTLSFDRLDRALPLPVDPRAEKALALAPVVNELGVYTLRVSGLKAERYEVSIDGAPVATVARADLEKGWSLAGVNTPMQAQALEVLQLVFKKNDLYFQRWRKVQLDPQRQAELPALDEQIAAAEAGINAARQPKPHHFELKPAAGA